MVIELNKDLKVRLLRAVHSGKMIVSDFPELFEQAPMNAQLFTPAQRDAEIQRLKAKLFDDGNSTD